MQSASRSRTGSGNAEYRNMGAVQGNDGQPWLDHPLTETPIESVESPHNEPSPRLSPAVLPLFFHRYPRHDLSPCRDDPCLRSARLLYLYGKPSQFYYVRAEWLRLLFLT